MMKIGVSGARGRMGERIIALAKQSKEIEVAFGLEDESHPDAGQIVDKIMITADPAYIEKCECLIEFSSPAATVAHLPFLVKFKN